MTNRRLCSNEVAVAMGVLPSAGRVRTAVGMCKGTCSGQQRRAAQVHFPFPAYGNKLLAEALAQAVGEGLCRAVGVCNYGGEQLSELHGLLAQRGVPLASNQARSVQHSGSRAQGSGYLVPPGTQRSGLQP